VKELQTAFGKVRIAEREKLFSRLIDILETASASFGDPFTIGLTGGATPKAFYAWAREEEAISKAIINHAVWSVSDERFVPLTDPESNFGIADRELLVPFDVPAERKCPWPIQVDPHSAALVFERRIRDRFGSDHAFDVCILGMGEDGHTASIFPGSPLMAIQSGHHFAPVEVPGKGWRLSITPDGLATCGRIVVMVTGSAKARRLRAVLRGLDQDYPIQILSRCARRVEWLVDEDAAAGL